MRAALVLTAFVQGSIIALLTLASYFIGHYFEYGTFDISQVITNPEAGVEGTRAMAFLDAFLWLRCSTPSTCVLCVVPSSS